MKAERNSTTKTPRHEEGREIPEPENGFWGIIDLFGHQRLAGYVSEFALGGETFVRVDVPDMKDRKGFTRFFGKGAIYSLSPVAKEIALRLVEAWRVKPIQPFEMQLGAIEHEPD